MKINKCPHCNKKHFIPEYVEMNIDSYGSSIVHFPCIHCKKIVKAYGCRFVVFEDIQKTNKENDWE